MRPSKEVPLFFVCPHVNQNLIIHNHKLMEIKKLKELYDAPAIMIVEMKTEGIICQSLTNPTDYTGGGDPFND